MLDDSGVRLSLENSIPNQAVAQGPAMIVDEERAGGLCVDVLLPLYQILPQFGGGGGMKRCQARLVEFGVANLSVGRVVIEMDAIFVLSFGPNIPAPSN